MVLTYADREMVLRLFDSLKPRGETNDLELVAMASRWAERLRPSVGFEDRLLRDVTTLCRYLTSVEAEDLKEVARGALRYCLRTDDVIPDATPVFGLQDDAYIAGFAVHEIRTRLGEPATYSPPKLTAAERSDAERLFQAFHNRPRYEDSDLVAAANAFCDRIACFSGSGFFGRLARNVNYLVGLLSDERATDRELVTARAALSYLKDPQDSVDDNLGLAGFLDDNFVVQTAVDLIAPGRDPWLNLLDSVAEHWPFINRIVFSESGRVYPLSEFMIVNSALSCTELRTAGSTNVIALVLPRSGPTPVILAFLGAVALIQESIRTSLASVAFKVGQRVIVDNGSTATFMGFETIHGRPMFRLQQTKYRSHLWPIQDLCRISPTDQSRSNRGRLVHDQGRNLAPVSALEQIFYLQAPAQLGEIKKRVLVVTPTNEAFRQAAEICLLGQKLMDILPMGHLKADGDIEGWSSRFGELDPIVTFVADMERACELVEELGDVSLIVIDGSGAKKSATFNRLTSCGASTLVLVAESDSDGLDLLAKQKTPFWEWNDQDIRQLFWPAAIDATAPGNLATYEERVQRARRDPPDIRRVSFAPADHAMEAISTLDKLARSRGDENLDELDQMIATAHGLVLAMLQSVSKIDLDQRNRFQQRLEQIRQLWRQCYYLSAEERAAAQSVEDAVHQLLAALLERNPKQEMLATVVAADPDVKIVCRDLKACESLRKQPIGVSRSIVACGEIEDQLEGSAVVVGWFDRQRMSRLLLPPAASPLILLLYDVEYRWYEALTHRQQRQRSRRAALSSRATIFSRFSGGTAVTDPIERIEAPEERSILATLDGFERKAAEARRRRLLEDARTSGDEPEVEARPVFFSDGSHAFLTDGYQAKVVTHLLTPSPRLSDRAEVQLIDVDRLRIGDVLLFLRGSDRDVIREVADRLLPPGTRETATLWQRALRRFKQKHGIDSNAVWRRLQQGGCTHHRSTVRYWIESDEIIAPRDAHDHELRIIADVTADPELQQRFKECDKAVSAVWGAHLSASCRLAEQVVTRAAQQLKGGSSTQGLVEIESNVVLARVDDIQDEPVLVRRGIVNKLLEGNSWR
jgi:uncharacterized membrane protein YkvA (DUF1232 family)